MMSYKIRKSHERKFFDHGWLKTFHTFSFAHYYDPNFMGFRSLRVINEDRVAPGNGFPMHHHENMEIISIVLEGSLAHRDSMGTESVIHANDIQQMSAGTGVNHSEYNPSSTEPVHFLQIWILPNQENIQPRYQQMPLPTSLNEWILIASENGQQNSIKIQQDVMLYTASLEIGKSFEKNIPDHRYGWIQVIEGELSLNADTIQSGDGVAINPDTNLILKAIKPSRILFFDMN
ncbi:pirin family protein [Parachlamydia acanthamoebae]|uniref:pirin family protein n=1 Tax=Parachlamydia acanthamoebae TaxID=83552 RepID=UPI00126A0FEA